MRCSSRVLRSPGLGAGKVLELLGVGEQGTGSASAGTKVGIKELFQRGCACPIPGSVPGWVCFSVGSPGSPIPGVCCW